MTTVKQVWDEFCVFHRVAFNSVPLFACDDFRFVRIKEIGVTRKKKILVRHQDMDELILRETDVLIKDWSQGTHKYDGLIYITERQRVWRPGSKYRTSGVRSYGPRAGWLPLRRVPRASEIL